MNAFKKLIKSKKVIAWGISTLVFVAFIVTANILATNVFGSLINGVFGGERAIVDESVQYQYYKPDFETKDEALANGNAVTQEICEEGMVLLKNEVKDGKAALPLAQGAKVSIFGKNSVSLVYGGSGSAAPTQKVPLKTIYDSLEETGFQCNTTLRDFYKDNKKSGSGRPANVAMEHDDDPIILVTGETPISSYTADITSSYDEYGDAALVVFSRIAGENWDLPRVAADNKTRHYLELDNNERDLLKHICDSNKFEHIIVLFNGSNNIDMAFLKVESDPAYDAKIDGAILIGSPGATGIMALGRILNGTVNPSGHLTDTIYTHYDQDPTWQNFGDNSFLCENADYDVYGDSYLVNGGNVNYFMVAYEEGIYLGYRYYETRGQIEGEDWYNQHVLYPFGYGLSYTTFTQEITNKNDLIAAPLNATENFTVDVKVKNTGTKAGKQVVQLYASAPYEPGEIEKAYKVLVGFAKTDLLAPEAEQTLHIEVTPYDFASFDAEGVSESKFKGYILEDGEYHFFLGTDAHHDADEFVKTLAADATFANDPVTGEKVEPQFSSKKELEQQNTFLQQQLSRQDFANSFPQLPTEEDRSVDQKFINKENKYTPDNPDPDEPYVMPKMGANNGVHLSDLVGKEYDDPLWDEFLDQMNFKEMLDLFNKGMYATEKIQRLGVPKTLSCDGPTGLVAFMGDPAVYGTCYYCSECLVAQTYNVELAAKQGNAVGNEAVLGDKRTGADASHLPYTGWYSPGVNLHRSPFSGRNTEYYSEDPFISGKMAAKVIAASQEKGVYTTIKHFAVNEQETHRSRNGQNYWLKEQALRELYLKPFEIAIKEGRSKGLMSSFTRIGQRWCGGSYNLLTQILRNEWGFKGTVICDFHTDDYMDNAQMIYAGGDLNLTGTKYWSGARKSEVEDVVMLRRAAHNTLYALANSNAMNQKILGYKLPIWQELLFLGEGLLGAGFLAWGFFVVFTALGMWPKQRKKAAEAAAAEPSEPAEPKKEEQITILIKTERISLTEPLLLLFIWCFKRLNETNESLTCVDTLFSFSRLYVPIYALVFVSV